jgi:hypothetical protein
MAKKLSRIEKIRRFFTKNPKMSVAQVAAEFGVMYQVAYMAKRSMDKAQKDKDKVSALIAASNASVADKATENQNPNGMSAEDRAEMLRQAAARPRHRMQGAPTEGIDATLAERGTKYGKFRDTAAVIYKLKNVLRNHASEQNKSFAFDQAEALDMICHKLGRIVNGDPDYADSWIDIAGYAKLVADRLTTGKQV